MRKKLVKAIMRIFAALPLCVHHFNAHIIAFIVRDLIGYRKKVVRDNIDQAFPTLSEKERRKIFRGFYLHLGQIITEAIWFGGSSSKRILKSHIADIKNPEECARLSHFPGTICLFAHMGNWEILGGFEGFNHSSTDSGLREDNVAVIYRRLKNAFWDEIFYENRTAPLKNMTGYIESASMIRHIMNHPDNGIIYFVCTDQWPYFKSPTHTIVNFMGRKTRTMSGGAAVARKLGFAVTYLSITRQPNGKKYNLEFKPICDNASEMSVQEIMDRFYLYVEDDIRQDPSGYLWSHRRWQKAPDTI